MIVLSYRRADSAGFARALHERMSRQLGADRVFLDVETIEAGADFRDRLRDVVAAAEALVVVIGPAWLATRPDGQTRLDDADDPVRLEIATALAHGVRTVPVLVEGAAMPGRAALPAELADFADRNAVALGNERFDADVERLFDALGAGTRRRTRRRIAALVLLLLVSTLLLVGIVLRGGAEARTFAVTVRVHGPGGGEVENGGELLLDLGPDRRRQPIDANGQAVFQEIPARFRRDSVSLVPRVAGYDSAARRVLLPASGVLDVALVPARIATVVRGTVLDRADRPVAGVSLDFDSGLRLARTDSAGRFEVTIPRRAGSVLTLRAARNGEVGYLDNITIPERGPLTIRFDAGG